MGVDQGGYRPIFLLRLHAERQAQSVPARQQGKGLDPTNTGPLPYSEGLRTPGVFRIPVCASELHKQNLVNWGLRSEKRCDYYPCCEV